MLATMDSAYPGMERRSGVRRTRRIDDRFYDGGMPIGLGAAVLYGFALGLVVGILVF